MDQYLNVTEARTKLLDLLEELHGSNRVIITKHGKPRAVLVDTERYALLEDLAWLLQDPGHRAALQKSWNELQRGDVSRAARRAVPTVKALRAISARTRGQRKSR